MQLVNLVFAAIIGAMAGVLVGYFAFAETGELGSRTFSVWLDQQLYNAVWKWALAGAVAGFVARYLGDTRTVIREEPP
jgi:hypothetical protein